MLLGSQAKFEQKPKSFFKELKHVIDNGGNVVQVFLRKMHSSSTKDRVILSKEEEKEIKEYIKKNKAQVFVHASYLLNFCRIPAGLIRIQWAYRMLNEDMILGEKLGFKGAVIHMCSQKAVDEKWKSIMLSTDETIKRTINHIKYFFKNYGSNFKKIKLLLENSASDGHKIGGKMIELGKVFKPLHKLYKDRIGTCLDTCHAFSSGYALNTVTGMKNFLEEYKKYVGDYSTLKLFHLNDSKFPLGSKKDKHFEIGKGFIFSSKEGKEALCYLVNFCDKNKIPMCLETGGSAKKQINLIKKLCLKKGGYDQSGGNKRTLTKKKIVDILEEFYEIHKSLGNNIKANQYLKAVNSVKNSNVTKIDTGNEIAHLPWIGGGIVGKMNEYLETGKIKVLDDFKNNPIVLSHKNLTTVFGIGPKKASQLISKGIFNVKDLRKAKDVKLTKSQRVGLKYYNDLVKKIPRKEVEKIKKIIETEFKKLHPNKKTAVELAGSYRLGKKSSGDVDIILSLKDGKDKNVLQDFVSHLFDENILVDTLGQSTNNYMGVLKLKTARHIDLHLVEWDNIPFHLLYFGSGERFSREIRRIAKEKGYKLNEKGLWKGNKKLNVKTEKNVFKKLDLKWVPPEKRG